MAKWLFIFLLLISKIGVAQNEKVYEFNTTCQQAYKEIAQLKINNGKALIAKAKQQNVNNLIPYYLESYIDLLELFFNEDPEVYKQRKDNIDHRISLLKDGTETSPFYKFCISNLYLHRAMIRIKFGENTGAALDAKRSYSAIKDNRKLFSTFAPNDMLYGSLQTICGTIPKGYKWIASILGMKGNVNDGIKIITKCVQSNDPWAKFFSPECELLYCYLNYYINNKKDETLQHIFSGKFDLVNNHLFAYMAAQLSINNKQTDIGKNIIYNKNKSADYFQLPVWDFLLGNVKLYKLELTDAAHHYEKFLSSFKGNFYVKDIYQKLSWAYFLLGNMDACKKTRNNILTKGNTNTEADKQAQKEAKEGKWWNAILLKSRLLNDGGYNDDALKNLHSKTVNDFAKTEEKLEFVYRLARIYDDLNNTEEAIKYYNATIDLGRDRTEYYAARAALQTALIYEKNKNKNQAIIYFNKVLEMDDHDYKNSLDQKAKSGIARLTGE